MTMRILEKDAIAPLVSSLMAEHQVVGPKAKGPQFAFGALADPAELRLDYDTSILPPKVALQPPHEQLATFRLRGGESSVEPVVEVRPTVLLGMHTCDLHALRLLDRALTGNYLEAHYIERRRQTRIVSIECLQPCDEHSFCKDMGTFNADGGGYDLHLTDVGDVYVAHVGTEAGKALLERHSQARPATDDDVHRLNGVLGAKWPRFRKRLEFDAGELPSLLATAYQHSLWEELGEHCLSCAACTNVCPTCFCFNVVDSMALDQTETSRTRCWDSCQLDEFARVAGGESFREARAARQRHRFFRKGKWLVEKYGARGCVGCGRCIRTCLVHINIVDGFNAIHKSRGWGL